MGFENLEPFQNGHFILVFEGICKYSLQDIVCKVVSKFTQFSYGEFGDMYECRNKS